MNKIIQKYKIEYIITFLIFAGVVLCSFSRSIWGDEAFSLDIVNNSWKDMIHIAMGDVHPPLYYFILKPFIDLANMLGLNEIMIGKLVSFIPYVLMLIVGKKWIDKYCNGNVYSIWLLLLIGMPNLLYYGIEIRMYSWAELFVLLTFMYGYRICLGENKFFYLSLFALLSAYTHYYACISVAIIYFLILICSPNVKNIIKKWILSVLVCCIGYVPWLSVFASQLGDVKSEYWIEKITLKSIYEIFKFYFEPRIDTMHSNDILGAIVFLAIIFVLIYYGKKSNFKIDYLCSGWIVFTALFFITVVISIVVKPILVPRYLIIAAPLLWFSFAYALQTVKIDYLKKIIIAFLILVSLINVGQFYRWEQKNYKYYNEYTKLFEASEDVTVYTDTVTAKRCISYYYPDIDVENIKELQDEEIILKDGQKYWFVDTYSKDSLAILEGILDGREKVKLGEYSLEYMDFDVYEFNG